MRPCGTQAGEHVAAVQLRPAAEAAADEGEEEGAGRQIDPVGDREGHHRVLRIALMAPRSRAVTHLSGQIQNGEIAVVRAATTPAGRTAGRAGRRRPAAGPGMRSGSSGGRGVWPKRVDAWGVGVPGGAQPALQRGGRRPLRASAAAWRAGGLGRHRRRHRDGPGGPCVVRPVDVHDRCPSTSPPATAHNVVEPPRRSKKCGHLVMRSCHPPTSPVRSPRSTVRPGEVDRPVHSRSAYAGRRPGRPSLPGKGPAIAGNAHGSQGVGPMTEHCRRSAASSPPSPARSRWSCRPARARRSPHGVGVDAAGLRHPGRRRRASRTWTATA